MIFFFVMYAQFVAMLRRNYFKSCQHKKLYSTVTFYFLSIMFAISTGTYMVFPLSIGNCSLTIQCHLWMTPNIPDFSSGKYARMYMVCWCVLSEFNMKFKKFKMSIHPFSISSIFVCLGVKLTLLNQIKVVFFSLHEIFQ